MNIEQIIWRNKHIFSSAVVFWLVFWRILILLELKRLKGVIE